MNIFLTSFMRSGSSHVSNTIQRMGWRKSSIHLTFPGSYNEEPMIDAHAADFMFPASGQIFFAHMRAIGRNVDLLKLHEVPVVVMERNLLDSLLSWKESCDIDHAAGRGDQFIYAPIYGARWASLSEQQKWEWIVFNVVPWFVSFHLSWNSAEQQIPLHRIWYKDFFANQAKGLQNMLQFLKAEYIPRRSILEKMCDFRDGKFNVGVSGRGEEKIPYHVIETVKRSLFAWGDEDGIKLERELCQRN